MNTLLINSQSEIDNITRIRKNETKIGQNILVVKDKNNWQFELKNSTCKFVLLGIPEDIGVRANYGRGGAHTAWGPALDSFLNEQSNLFLTGLDCCVLGQVKVDDLMDQANILNIKVEEDILKLRKLVDELDRRVFEIIKDIIYCGKIPIIVGGGHNNAYPIIKGSSLAHSTKLNAINCDPHTDFRPLEGRHSGNGFSYAFNEGFLNKYSVLCIHEQYNTAQVLNLFKKHSNQLFFTSYEDVFVKENHSFANALNKNIEFVNDGLCGIEIDLDAITNVPSSAKTSSGILPTEARQYAYKCGKSLNAAYFHIAEGAPVLSHIKADNKTGKLIAYLISDFIKGVTSKNY